MTTCIDLQQRYRSKYRIRHEDDRETRLPHDPWLLVIDCQHDGEIYPHGGDMLGAATGGRGSVAKRLAALPCVRVVQDGSDGINVIFDVDDFPAVAAVMKPRRRRRLSPEHRAKLVAAGAVGRTALAQRHRSKHDSGDRRRAPAA